MSVLSESPQLIHHDGRRLAAYAGYVMPFSSFSTLLLWAICGPKIYHKIWDETGAGREIKALNAKDERLQHWREDTVGQFLAEVFANQLRNLGPDGVEQMLGLMLGVEREE